MAVKGGKKITKGAGDISAWAWQMTGKQLVMEGHAGKSHRRRDTQPDVELRLAGWEELVIIIFGLGNGGGSGLIDFFSDTYTYK